MVVGRRTRYQRVMRSPRYFSVTLLYIMSPKYKSPFTDRKGSLSGLRNNYDDYFHLTAGGLLMCILFAIFGVTSIMVAICSLSICRQRYLYLRHRRRTARAENRTIPHSVSTSSIIRPNAYGRAAFIAFTDGIQVEQVWLFGSWCRTPFRRFNPHHRTLYVCNSIICPRTTRYFGKIETYP